jgi:hypothetical protein
MLGYPAVEARDALKQWAILKDWLTSLKINDTLLLNYKKTEVNFCFFCFNSKLILDFLYKPIKIIKFI